MKRLLISSDDIPLPKRIGRFALVAVIALLLSFGSHPILAESTTRSAHAPIHTEQDEQEIVWLARTLYSETKRADEQEIIAWVVRNRVESPKYPDTYRQVVLETGQFSGLHPRDKQYGINVSLTRESVADGWDTALAIADEVYFSDGTWRPIDSRVTHFYSPHAVTKTPAWATATEPVHTIVDPKKNYTRFAFYSNIR